MTTDDLFTGLKPVTTACLKTFEPFYQERARHYVYPRYMQSVCVLTDQGGCLYKVIRAAHSSVLVIYRRTQIYGKLGIKMPVMPISLSGSAQDELSVIHACLRVGVSLRATQEDIRRYRIPRNVLSDGTGPLVPVNNEFIYQAQAGAAQKGPKYRKQRWQVNRLTKLTGYTLREGVQPEIEGVVRLWGEHYQATHSETADQLSLWRVCQSAPLGYLKIQSIYIDGTLQCFSVMERLASKQWVIVQRVRNYKTAINDVGTAMHWADCQALTEGEAEPVYMNMGLADTAGLIHAKEALLPCAHQKIWTVRTNKTSETLKRYFR